MSAERAEGDPISRDGPRRSALVQERSRQTRRKLVRAAMELWTERGFETGFEETTAEEIALRAGVTKGTFYFHFARKEQILHEIGFSTAQALYEDALRTLADGQSVDDAFEVLVTKLAHRIEAQPRGAVRRSLTEFGRTPAGPSTGDKRFGFSRAYAAVFFHAQQSGELPTHVSVTNLSSMLSALVTEAIMLWTRDDTVQLGPALRERTALLLAGARHMVPADNARSGRSRTTVG